ncbi:MAG: hypothetical protein K2X81_27165 [Candidatus Obscuribacterales bacterium]|nr:hypothetical protein [Candidatus Obscuribacterales bacterium]
MTGEFQKIKITETLAVDFATREAMLAASVGDSSGVTARLVESWKPSHREDNTNPLNH